MGKKKTAPGGGAKTTSPTRAKAPARQLQMTAMFDKKLDKPRDDINHKIGVPYDHWDYDSTAAGKAAEAEAKKVGTFACAVVDFELVHKFPSVGAKPSFKSDAFKLQLVEEEDGMEPFWLQYPQPHLRFRNSPESKKIDPELHREPDVVVLPPPPADAREQDAEDADAESALLSPMWKHVTLVGEGTYTEGKLVGKKYKLVTCNIIVDGKRCGAEAKLACGATGNYFKHCRRCIKSGGVSGDAHRAVLDSMERESVHTNTLFDEDGEKIGSVLSFDESFNSYCAFTYMVIEDKERMAVSRKKGFRGYVRSLNKRAIPPSASTVIKIAKCIGSLQLKHQLQRIADKRKKFRGGPCVGLQLDMWTDDIDGESFACLNMTTANWIDEVLTLQNEILAFEVFPFRSHTAEHIKKWFEDVLQRKTLNVRMVDLIAPDGAADGQAAMNLIPELEDKKVVCWIHDLQRAVLSAVSCAGSSTSRENPDCRDLIRRHARTVQLHSQSKTVRSAMLQAQLDLKIPKHKVLKVCVCCGRRLFCV